MDTPLRTGVPEEEGLRLFKKKKKKKKRKKAPFPWPLIMPVRAFINVLSIVQSEGSLSAVLSPVSCVQTLVIKRQI